jgi:nucleoside-diphosphate-sugar epimerase
VKVLVTGTGGFIGGHVARHLAAAGHDVLGLDRRPQDPVRDAQVRQLDLLDAAATRAVFQEFAPDVVLHLAARTDLDEEKDISAYRDNIDAVRNVVAAIRAQPSVQRWVCTSSQLVCRIGYTPTHDEDYAPNTLYGQSKVLTEQICRSSEADGVPWTIVRPTTIWGPNMNPHYLRFFALIRDGRYFHIGRSPLRKSYGYVGNTVAQYARLATIPIKQVQGRTLYLADYEPIDLRLWAEGFRAALGAPPIRQAPVWLARTAALAGDVIKKSIWRGFPFTSFRLRNVLTEYQFDLSATAAVCGPLPYSTEDGISETTAWLRNIWSGPSNETAGSLSETRQHANARN